MQGAGKPIEGGAKRRVREIAYPIIASDPAAAMRAAATHHGPVVVAGSLYLVGAVRKGLMRSGVLPNDGLV